MYDDVRYCNGGSEAQALGIHHACKVKPEVGCYSMLGTIRSTKADKEAAVRSALGDVICSKAALLTSSLGRKLVSHQKNCQVHCPERR